MSNASQKIEVRGSLNWPTEAVMANVEHAIRRQLPQIQPHAVQSQPIGLVLGGPSLMDSLEYLRDKHADGMKLVSVNGTHDWLLDRRMRSSAFVMIDARSHNARFVKRWQYKTKYLIASQCHPRVFDTLKDADVRLFHATSHPRLIGLLDEYYFGRYCKLDGGSTVALRAIPLLRMLGFTHIEVFGFDSCYRDDQHHAYQQSENADFRCAKITVAGREFVCDSWMHSQAREFLMLTKHMGNQINLVVHGDGLIAHMIKHGTKYLEEE